VYWYNFSVQEPPTSLTWADVHLKLANPPQTLDSNDTPVVNLTIRATGGGLVASYDLLSASPNWTSGGSAIIGANETAVVTSSLSTILGGDTLWVTVTGYPGDFGSAF
jgi:hypothetical protein